MPQLLNPQQSEKFQLALAQKLDLDPSKIDRDGFLLEIGYDDLEMVRVTWQGLASVPVTEVNELLQEAQS